MFPKKCSRKSRVGRTPNLKDDLEDIQASLNLNLTIEQFVAIVTQLSILLEEFAELQP